MDRALRRKRTDSDSKGKTPVPGEHVREWRAEQRQPHRPTRRARTPRGGPRALGRARGTWGADQKRHRGPWEPGLARGQGHSCWPGTVGHTRSQRTGRRAEAGGCHTRPGDLSAGMTTLPRVQISYHHPESEEQGRELLPTRHVLQVSPGKPHGEGVTAQPLGRAQPQLDAGLHVTRKRIP